MLIALLTLVVLTLLAVLALLLRKPAVAPQDSRLDALPAQFARLEAVTETRLDTIARALRTGIEGIERDLSAARSDAAQEAAEHRTTAANSAIALRDEITRILTHLGGTLTTHLADFRTHSADTLGAHRTDTSAAAETLRAAVKQDLDAISHRLSRFMTEAGEGQLAARDALHIRLTDLGAAQTTHQERLRSTVEQRLDLLNTTNAAKLEEMRATVDEKLHATLHSRLTESFGQVTDQLSKVHSGLGEMSKLSEGVDGLSRIFTNVKSRGGFAEVQLGMLLEQMLAPAQFLRNARIKPNTLEAVEFAVKFPSHAGETLLPIDAKFPREAWERLENAYTANDPELLASAGKAFEAAIRTEAKRICDKYINPPLTTPHAIMFLPTEGLYAEVMRRDALQAEIQSKCHVTIAGPSTLSAILTSFQMGFNMLAIQEKGDEVWTVLESAKTEFGKFGKLMDKVEGDVGKIQKTLGEVGVRTRAINRTLREVSETEAPTAGTLIAFEDGPGGIASRLAAGDETP